MNARNYTPGDRTMKPGPGAHRPEMVNIMFCQNTSNHLTPCVTTSLKKSLWEVDAEKEPKYTETVESPFS